MLNNIYSVMWIKLDILFYQVSGCEQLGGEIVVMFSLKKSPVENV